MRRGVRREGRRAEKRGVRSRVDVPQDQKAIIHHAAFVIHVAFHRAFVRFCEKRLASFGLASFSFAEPLIFPFRSERRARRRRKRREARRLRRELRPRRRARAEDRRRAPSAQRLPRDDGRDQEQEPLGRERDPGKGALDPPELKRRPRRRREQELQMREQQ